MMVFYDWSTLTASLSLAKMARFSRSLVTEATFSEVRELPSFVEDTRSCSLESASSGDN